MKFLHTIAFVLVIVGGLNWGLIGLFDFNLVAALFGDMSSLSRIVYTLVGVSAVVAVFTEFATRRRMGAASFPDGTGLGTTRNPQ